MSDSQFLQTTWPIVALADASGSMAQDGKIDALNASIRALIEACLGFAAHRGRIEIAVVAFGGGMATAVMDIGTPALSRWTDLAAEGASPLGAALDLAGDIVQARVASCPGCLYPLFVLLSDGSPTDMTSWHEASRRLQDRSCTERMDRAAIAIGPDADLDLLGAFVGDGFVGRGPGTRVFRPGEEPRVLAVYPALPIDPKLWVVEAFEQVAPPSLESLA